MVRLVTLEAVAIALGIWVLELSQPGWILWVAGLAVLLFFSAAVTASVLKAVVRPLRALTNVVEAYRKGDYTIRSSREVPGDALGDLVHEINSLGITLHQQRLQAMEATALLEKLIVYEAVHEIRGWTDLKNRLEADRRCFAFFHPRMPDEPLIFVEVALTRGIADSIHPLLDESAPLGDPMGADTAIFYSISNCQKGLAGISFGNFLIKRVVDSLAAELPRLKAFATLSPSPGFRNWLDELLAAGENGVLSVAEQRAIDALPNGSGASGLRQLLGSPGWHESEPIMRALRAPLLRLCARFLMLEKTAAGRARDPVAHFHLSNGARLERLNWAADLSPKGLQQSAGIMMNYLYRLSEIESNHEAYTAEGMIAASTAIRTLIR